MSGRAAAIGVLVLALVSAVWWTAIAGPTRADLALAREELVVAEAEAALLAARAPVDGDGGGVVDDVVDEVDAERAAAEAEAARAALADAVPAEVDLAALLRTTGELAAAEGLGLVSVVPGVPEGAPADGGPESIPVTLQLQGPLDGLVRFLAALAAQDRVVVVEHVVVAPVDPTTADPTLDITLGLRAFSGTPAGTGAVDDGVTVDATTSGAGEGVVALGAG